MMIFILRGTSCSGKDTFANKYFPQHTILSSDDLRLRLLNSMKDQTRNKIVFDLLRQMLEYRLTFGAEYTVINATNLRMRDVNDYLKLARRYGAKVTVISIDPPSLEELNARSTKREEAGGLGIPEEVFVRHLETYQNNTSFFEDAARNDEFKWIRIGQDEEVIDEI